MTTLRPVLLAVSVLVTGCGEPTTSNGYQGEITLSLYATNTITGWTFDEAHDIFWDGESTSTYEVSCTIHEDGLVQTYVLVAKDANYEQGLETTITVAEYDGDGTTLLVADATSPPFDLTLRTADQTYDLETRSSGECSVGLSDEGRYGTVNCPGLDEFVLNESLDLPFTVTGEWECAQVGTDE